MVVTSPAPDREVKPKKRIQLLNIIIEDEEEKSTHHESLDEEELEPIDIGIRRVRSSLCLQGTEIEHVRRKCIHVTKQCRKRLKHMGIRHGGSISGPLFKSELRTSKTHMGL